MNTTKVAEGIFRITAHVDTDILFEGLWPLPHGVTLNSFLVRGNESALIDGVCDWDGVPETLYAQLAQMEVELRDIRYAVLNHLEPDHTGWLSSLRALHGDFEIVTTKKGEELVRAFYGLDIPVRTVKSGDSIDLGGGKRLLFTEIPNVHWPETMATYEESTGTLFPCDAFGSFGGDGSIPYDDEMDEKELGFYRGETLRYYANIVARFSDSVLRAIEKLGGIDVRIVAPAHGIVWRRDPGYIIDLYRRYAEYAKGTAEPVITVIWGSMYGNTERAVASLLEGIESAGIKTRVFRVPETHESYILSSAWESTGIVLGMPTYEYHMFPPMAAVLEDLGRKGVVNREAFRFGSYGWSGGAQKELDEIMNRLKMKWNFIEPLEFRGAPTEKDLAILRERGRDLALRVKKRCGLAR